jgi:lactate dehydrogenase-like 2-hydroxyacid dehydrogenase
MERVHLLSLGGLMPQVVQALEERFEVHHLDPQSCAGIITPLGPEIRAIATHGHDAIGEALFSRLPRLEIIANFGVGYDSIDLSAVSERGIIVTNTPQVLDDEVADLTVGLLLATVRRLPQADRYLREGHWLRGPFPLSPTLRTRTVGMIGMGRIGRKIARRISAFDVPVVYHARGAKPELPWRHYGDLLTMARDVDTLIAIVPGGAGTRHMVNAEVLRALGPEGILINVARGSVVDEPALISALQSGTILGAGLDVFADEPRVPQALVELDNVVLVPHVGSATHHTRGIMGQLVVDNLVSWFQGKGPITPVPETPWPKPHQRA